MQSYNFKAHGRVRGQYPDLTPERIKQDRAAEKRMAEKKVIRAAYLATLPEEIGGLSLNKQTGELTDDQGNYILTVRTGKDVAEIEADIEEMFACDEF